MTSLHQYLTNNHKKFTAREMAEELSLHLSKVQKTLSNMGLKALSPAEKVKNFIQEHPNAVLEDIAVLFELSTSRISVLAKEAGIRLKRRSQEKEKQKLDDFEWTDEAKVKLEKYGITVRNEVKRFSDRYTQTGSPFGLADGLRNIEIK